MCDRKFFAQCETTQNRDQEKGASLFGYTKMYGQVPGGQAEHKGLQLRMGQAHVRQWTDEILPLLEGEEDPLGVDDLTTHRLPLDRAPEAYSMFQKKEDGRSRSSSSPEPEEVELRR